METGAKVHIDGKGLGTYLGTAAVYVWRTKTGDLKSLSDAETKPEVTPDGCEGEPIVLTDNPKFSVDATGEVVYGCQIWWQPLNEPDEEELFQARMQTEVGQQVMAQIIAKEGLNRTSLTVAHLAEVLSIPGEVAQKVWELLPTEVTDGKMG